MSVLEHEFEYEQWDGQNKCDVVCKVTLLRIVKEGDGLRHGNYRLRVFVRGAWTFNGHYWLTRVRRGPGGLSLEVTDVRPPRKGYKWYWHPEEGWDTSPIGALDWVEDRVLLWVFGMDELLDDVNVLALEDT